MTRSAQPRRCLFQRHVHGENHSQHAIAMWRTHWPGRVTTRRSPRWWAGSTSAGRAVRQRAMRASGASGGELAAALAGATLAGCADPSGSSSRAPRVRSEATAVGMGLAAR